jgi:hypothetical protein
MKIPEWQDSEKSVSQQTNADFTALWILFLKSTFDELHSFLNLKSVPLPLICFLFEGPAGRTAL